MKSYKHKSSYKVIYAYWCIAIHINSYLILTTSSFSDLMWISCEYFVNALWIICHRCDFIVPDGIYLFQIWMICSSCLVRVIDDQHTRTYDLILFIGGAAAVFKKSSTCYKWRGLSSCSVHVWLTNNVWLGSFQRWLRGRRSLLKSVPHATDGTARQAAPPGAPAAPAHPLPGRHDARLADPPHNQDHRTHALHLAHLRVRVL